jgi:hypothetical protein
MKVVTGGQTGVDRAALDAAMFAGFDCGGWCPKGRRAEDGPIPSRYPLIETGSERYDVRTRRNVADSDATLILCDGRPAGGTLLTAQYAERIGKPVVILDINDFEIDPDKSLSGVREWLTENGVTVLNIAGPRESGCPGIYARARHILGCLFDGL